METNKKKHYFRDRLVSFSDVQDDPSYFYTYFEEDPDDSRCYTIYTDSGKETQGKEYLDKAIVNGTHSYVDFLGLFITEYTTEEEYLISKLK